MANALISARMVGSVLGEAADRRYLGGRGSQAIEVYHAGAFVFRLANAVRSIKRFKSRELAERIAAALREVVPVREGDLRESIRVEEDRKGFFKIIVGGTPATMKRMRAEAPGVEFDVALGIEFGTRKMPAQPFFWNTIDRFAPEIERELAAQLIEEFS